ncbi:MAG: DUF349 domain-containing protein [Actinomycetaceae bacterium]|nr:DUF349 domain-containing protein [Actinomycetaceae bacterium]
MTDQPMQPSQDDSAKMTSSTQSPKPPAPQPPKLNLPDSAEKQEAEQFGRIDEAGNVYVKDTDGEREVGQFPDIVPDNPFDLFIRRYLDLKAQLALFETRIRHISPREIDKTIKSLTEQLQEPAAIGDLQKLRDQLERLKQRAEQYKEEMKLQRQAAKEQALADREAIVVQAEEIAAQDPQRTQWKDSGQRLRNLLEEWKTSQRHGVRIERSKEDALWKRFSQARTTFDRSRRQFFHDLDVAQAEAKKAKEDIIRRAEELATSTEWGPTTIAFRQLMDEWKASGRASRRDDDALWERFWAAQNKFYEARNASNAAQAQEYQANLDAKEAILTKAEAILPISDIEKAKAQLRPLQDEWDAIGHVPKADMGRIEARMRAVEKAISDAEDALWHKENPEVQARAQGMAGQLEESIAELSADLEKARAEGNDKKVAELEESLKARQTWLEQVRSVTE